MEKIFNTNIVTNINVNVIINLNRENRNFKINYLGIERLFLSNIIKTKWFNPKIYAKNNEMEENIKNSKLLRDLTAYDIYQENKFDISNTIKIVNKIYKK